MAYLMAGQGGQGVHGELFWKAKTCNLVLGLCCIDLLCARIHKGTGSLVGKLSNLLVDPSCAGSVGYSTQSSLPMLATLETRSWILPQWPVLLDGKHGVCLMPLCTTSATELVYL